MTKNQRSKPKPIAILITVLITLAIPAASALAGTGENLPAIPDDAVIADSSGDIYMTNGSSYSAYSNDDSSWSDSMSIDPALLLDRN